MTVPVPFEPITRANVARAIGYAALAIVLSVGLVVVLAAVVLPRMPVP